MTKTLKQYQELRDKINAYRYALSVISWDSETEAPAGCFEHRARQIGVLSAELYKFQTARKRP